MNWLTTEYIKEQSQISDEAALECSIEHWQQIYDATVDDIKNHGFPWSDECSLCQRYSRSLVDCGICPLMTTSNLNLQNAVLSLQITILI